MASALICQPRDAGFKVPMTTQLQAGPSLKQLETEHSLDNKTASMIPTALQTDSHTVKQNMDHCFFPSCYSSL